MATIFDNFAQRRLSPPRRSVEGERVTSLVRPGSPFGSQRAFRHSETQLVAKNVTGFTPLRDYAATYVAPDRAFPNYESQFHNIKINIFFADSNPYKLPDFLLMLPSQLSNHLFLVTYLDLHMKSV